MEKLEKYDGRAFVMDSLHVSRLLAEMRHQTLQRDAYRFRENATEIGHLLAYEVEMNEPWKTHKSIVETSLGLANHELRDEEPILFNVLRAGNPLVRGFKQVFRQAPVIFQGAERMEGSYDENNGEMEVRSDYTRVPIESLAGKTLIIPDIMLATGSSLEKSCKAVFQKYGHPKQIVAAAVIAAPIGVERVLEHFPGSRVYVAALDERLNDQAYIVPGLGDAGDLAYNGGSELLDLL
jgi:uracil phosphoribosyltransferase